MVPIVGASGRTAHYPVHTYCAYKKMARDQSVLLAQAKRDHARDLLVQRAEERAQNKKICDSIEAKHQKTIDALHVVNIELHKKISKISGRVKSLVEYRAANSLMKMTSDSWA